MKKKERSIIQVLKPVKLYYNDLVELVNILKEVNPDIRIETDSYTLDNIEELLGMDDELITVLKMSINDPYFSIDFEPDYASIYASDDTFILRGLFEKVKKILMDKRRKLFFLYQNSFFPGLMTGLSMLPLAAGIEENNIYLIISGFILLITSIIFWKKTHTIRFSKYSMIYLSKSIEFPSFWKRRKDDIFLAVISAVIGALLTFLTVTLLG